MNALNGTAPLGRYEVNAGATIAPGNLVALNAAGKAVPAADTAGLKVIGVAARIIDGMVEVVDGVMSFANGTGGAALARVNRGDAAYVVNADTVGKTGTKNIVAGVVVDVDDDGYVYIDTTPAALAQAALLAHAAKTAAAAHASA